MESLHQGYEDVMSIPVGRRKRILEEHTNLLRWRKQKQDAENPDKKPPRTRR